MTERQTSARLNTRILGSVLVITLICAANPAVGKDKHFNCKTAQNTVEQQVSDFLDLKFGMFIHFNLATYKDQEWVNGYHSPGDFNPGGPIDTDAWADAAKSAGMTYAVLTTKHMGGFCLWDSKYTTYDVMHPDCPYQQDFVAQFVESFKSRGLKVGLYYCWRDPGLDTTRLKVLPPECDPAEHSVEEQKEFMMKQVAELVEKYPDVIYIWNDGLEESVMTAEQAIAFFRSLRPDGPGVIASSNWWGKDKKGTRFVDIAINEGPLFREGNTTPGEVAARLEAAWFWKTEKTLRENEKCIKRAKKLDSPKGHVQRILASNSRHSNYLLDVGPDRNGNITESSLKQLAEIGKLLKASNK